MPDLDFTSAGTAKVLNDQKRIRKGAKAIGDEYKDQNRALVQLGKDAVKTFDATRLCRSIIRDFR